VPLDTKQLLEMLKTDIKHWSHGALTEALDFCQQHLNSMDEGTEVYAWWYDLRESIRQQIIAKGGRVP